MRRNRNKPKSNDCNHPAIDHGVGNFAGRLSADAIETLVAGAIHILETIGLGEVSPHVHNRFSQGGAGDLDGRVTIPSKLVFETLEAMPKTVLLAGQVPTYDMHVGGQNVYLGTGGAAPLVQDLRCKTYREATLSDLYDAARIANECAHIDFFARSLVARDIADPMTLDRATAAAALMGCAKHVMVQATAPEHLAPIAALCYEIAGSAEAFKARPFLSLNVNHSVPPLRLHNDSMDVIEQAVSYGIPVHCNVFGQVGASSPVTIAGAVAQTLAETLAGLVWVHIIKPDAPRIAGPRPMITDLRSGGLAGGSGEQAMANSMVLQVLRHWNIPCSIIAGATGSRHIDYQSGFEKALSISMAISAGANLVTQAAGSQASLMGTSLAGMVADNDMLGATLRGHAPIEMTEDALGLDAIKSVVNGEGHFLGQPETYARMRSDFIYPEIAERAGATELDENSTTEMQDRALQRAQEILTKPAPKHVPQLIRKTLANEFKIASE